MPLEDSDLTCERGHLRRRRASVLNDWDCDLSNMSVFGSKLWINTAVTDHRPVPQKRNEAVGIHVSAHPLEFFS